MKTIHVLIADDHHLFIQGLTALLDETPDICFLGFASNGVEALELAETHPDADLFIMDLSMPEMDGIKTTAELKKRKSHIPVLALTQNDDGGSVARAMKAGVAGYILKTASREEFVDAIYTVASGGNYFSPLATNALVLSMTGKEQGGTKNVEALTEREKEILILIANELTTNEIAEQLFISPYTVETHRKNLIQKLSVRNVAGLVRYAVEHGLAKE
ncbi:MAG: response regulator transcription factor [Ignavibacteriae bacterium]|nr:response regulator transcription factor [Ignavibacteriota bacterium]MCB9216826.1 response regulator transcription factor [Ignavibacteria bacterium]